MAVLFTNPNSDTFITRGSAVLTAPPISFLVRFNPNAVPPIAQTFISIERTPAVGFGGFNGFFLRMGSSLEIQAIVLGVGIGTARQSVTGSCSLDAWQTCAAVFSATEVTAYYNGVAGTPTALVTLPDPATMVDTIIATKYTSTSGAYVAGVNGCLAEIATYATLLEGKDVAAFHAGWSARLIKPESLVSLMELKSNATKTIDLIGTPWTANTGAGSFADCNDGPRIILPSGFQIGQGTVTPEPTTSRRFYFIERMDNRIWATIEDTWCLDAALAYPMPEPDATLEASSATGDGAIREYNLINGGSGYTSPIGQIEDVEGGGTGATITLGLTSGVITTADANAIGSGYVRPVLTILDATGSGASIAPIISNYATFSASANVFDSGHIGDILRMGGGQAEVISINSGASVIGNILSPITLVTPNDPDDTPLPATSGNWSITTPTSSVSGLWHLEGKTVSALADGGVVNDLTVDDGAVSLPVPATQILVGLPFTAQAQLMYLDAGGGPTIQTRRKSGVQAVVRVENSRAPEIGMNQPDAAAQPNQANVPWTTGMTEIKYRTPDMTSGQPAPLMSGDLDITGLFGTYDTKGQVAIQQRDCVPLSISAVVLWVTLGDSAGQ